MSRFILKLSVFLVWSGIVYVVGVVAFGLAAPAFLKKNVIPGVGGQGQSFTRFREADTARNVDIYVLGSSRAYRGYDPRIFDSIGYRMFNLGSSAQTPQQTRYLFDRYVAGNMPSLVIIDVYPSLLGSDGIESRLDLIANLPFDPSFLASQLNVPNTKLFNSVIYSTFRSLSGLNRRFVEAKQKGADNYIAGGYVQSFQQYQPGKEVKLSRSFIIEEGQVEALKELVNSIKLAGLSYVLVQSPLTAKAYREFPVNAYADSLFRSLGTYYNFNVENGFTDELFFDAYHLNQKGVAEFNSRLIDSLSLLPR